MGLRSKIMFLFALALATGSIVYTLIGPGGGGKRDHLQVELDRILEENRRLREENRRLVLKADALKQRRDYLEKVARDELGLVKKDDLIFRVSEKQPDGGSSDAVP